VKITQITKIRNELSHTEILTQKTKTQNAAKRRGAWALSRYGSSSQTPPRRLRLLRRGIIWLVYVAQFTRRSKTPPRHAPSQYFE
jgi:hypothetical protein